jgi:diguanylate cyclase (GGDEF)-like protein
VFSSRQSDSRFSSRILPPVLLAGGLAVLLVIGLLFFATRQTDDLARERQERLVSHVLGEQVARISHDQESVTIWDDAITYTAHAFDPDWVDVNLGVWMHDYFGHDRAFVFNAQDEVIYAMADGAAAHASTYSAARNAIEPLVGALRSRLREAAGGEATAGPELFRSADLAVIEARPAIVSVLPIVSDSGEILPEPGNEYLHAAVRFLDASFLDELMQTYLLEEARFSWTGEVSGRAAAFPLLKKSGDVLGYFVWRPEMPGWHLARRAAPLVAIILLVVGSIVAWLARRLRVAWTELQASEAQASHLAFHDPLTGLPNRALFNDRLDRALTEIRQSGKRLALLYLDLDRFKNVNDTLGHPAGDDLIRELSKRLTEILRGSDCIARFGGDEFAVLLADATSTEDVEALCKRIIHAASRPFDLLGKTAFVGISIGVAIAPDSGTDRAELMRKADIALYRAKAEGRSRYRIFAEEMDRFLRRRREIEAELRAAVEAAISSWSSTSRSSRPIRMSRWAWRPCCGGSTRRTAPSRPPSSFRSPRRPGSCRRSANGCCVKPARKRRAGRASGLPSTFPRCSSAAPALPTRCLRSCRRPASR